ncbi:hypothetical protein, partial [Lactobacillus acidophilus]|uniref:hypothetical protein n=1 Tax=Lactobacillus acidophilus TaxID=1579 RepID=UPI003F538816
KAYKIFRKKTIKNGGIPFELNQPSARLKNAMKSKDYIEFDSAKEGLDWMYISQILNLNLKSI